MLSDKIGELTGRVTGTRVLPGDDYRYVKRYVNMEVSIQQSGQIYGVTGTDFGTYAVFERVPGRLYGQGILEIPEGGAIWNGHDVSRMSGGGMATSFRFSLAFQAVAAGKLARMNEVLVIGEHEADEAGNTKTTFWEWK